MKYSLDTGRIFSLAKTKGCSFKVMLKALLDSNEEICFSFRGWRLFATFFREGSGCPVIDCNKIKINNASMLEELRDMEIGQETEVTK